MVLSRCFPKHVNDVRGAFCELSSSSSDFRLLVFKSDTIVSRQGIVSMDLTPKAQSAVAMAIWFLVQTLIAGSPTSLPSPCVDDEDSSAVVQRIVDTLGQCVGDPLASVHFGLQSLPVSNPPCIVNEDLGYWVKPRSTTWFSWFLMVEYDDTRWIEMFRMPKRTVFALADLLHPYISRQDTTYRVAIPVLIRVACSLFKLTYGVSFVICSKLFAIGRSTVCGVLRDMVHAINVTLKQCISWPVEESSRLTQEKFLGLCGLPSVVGAIDGTHIAIAKPRHGAPDYFYFKSGGYSLNCQAVVDSDKRFLDLYLGMPGSTNDSRVLRRSSLYNLATHNNFFNCHGGQEGFSPYLIGDQGYPLLPWLMVPYKQGPQLSLAERLFNRKLRRGCCVVENAFGILKQTFRELNKKTDLHVSFLPDVILCCALLHNMLLGQSQDDIQNLLGMLRREGFWGEGDNDDVGHMEADVVENVLEPVHAGVRSAAGAEKRQLLGVHLTTQRPQGQ